VRVTTPDSIGEAHARLKQWLAAGHHGEMDWIDETAVRRADPRTLWPDVRSVIVLGVNYGSGDDPLASLALTDRATVSTYARHRDYHDVVKGKLKQLAGFLAARSGHDVKVFVDTAPLMEKPLAAAAGIGWQGKHTVLVSRDFGNWLFLGSILSAAELPPDAAALNHCGTCTRCLDVCPTEAFVGPYQLDARRCISYLTIEHKGPIPRELRAKMGNHVFGCDDCLAVCPWNKFAKASHEAKLVSRDDLKSPALADLVRLDEAGFRRHFSGSPIKRTGRDRFVRNVLVAIGNSGNPAFVSEAERLIGDASPLVRGAAVWALSRLLPAAEFAKRAAAASAGEVDADVCEEWRAALAPEAAA
jgi:epoxyqueuosine reductase